MLHTDVRLYDMYLVERLASWVMPTEIKIKFDLFCISLDLDNFLTLKNANIFVFSSLNRNFALSLQAE